MNNNDCGTITADHENEIVEVFGEIGRKIAQKLKNDENATMLGELFKHCTEKP